VAPAVSVGTGAASAGVARLAASKSEAIISIGNAPVRLY
jgi:hypothetical protein